MQLRESMRGSPTCFSVTDRKLEPVHNHGSFFSGGVPVFHKPDLITTQKLGQEVVEALREGSALLLRGNGQVTVGRTIPEAVMMAIYLEEAARDPSWRAPNWSAHSADIRRIGQASGGSAPTGGYGASLEFFQKRRAKSG